MWGTQQVGRGWRAPYICHDVPVAHHPKFPTVLSTLVLRAVLVWPRRAPLCHDQPERKKGICLGCTACTWGIGWVGGRQVLHPRGCHGCQLINVLRVRVGSSAKGGVWQLWTQTGGAWLLHTPGTRNRRARPHKVR